MANNTITPIQAYTAARAAGFPPATARQMVAIAQRESSLNPGVVGTINAAKETSYGLWQINWKDAGIRALLQRNGITDPAQLYDPATNARAAALLWGGNDANLNTAWYINRTGNQYGYAEKYQANLAKLPPVEDLEAVYTGGGALTGSNPTLRPAETATATPQPRHPSPSPSPQATVTITCPHCQKQMRVTVEETATGAGVGTGAV